MIGNSDPDQVVEEIRDRLDESEDDQAERIMSTASDFGMDPEALLDAEANLELVIGSFLPPETTDGLHEILGTIGPFVGMDRSTVEELDADALSTLLAQGASAHPQDLARAVRHMDAALRDAGAYDDLDIEQPRPGDLRSEVGVDGGDA